MLSSMKAPGIERSSGAGEATTASRLCSPLGLSSRSRSDESLAVAFEGEPRAYRARLAM